MKGRHLLLLAALLAAPLQAAPLRINDDNGVTLTFSASPQRIVSLAPHITELAYAAGLGGQLVAVTAYSDFPAAARQLPQVGDAFRLDWERLLALKPDLVLAWQSGLSARDRAMFGKLGLKLLVLDPHRLDDIPKALRLLGQVAQSNETAEAAARAFEQQRDELRRRYAHPPLVRAYFQIATAPLLTVNGTHIISDVLRLCGAENVFAAAPLLTPTISAEGLLAAQPALFFALAANETDAAEARRSWRTLPTIPPAAFIPPDLMSRAGPRILQGAAQVCEQVAAVRMSGAH
ncbi:MAG: ABC transporter substrate-binding protein [Nitrosomonadales bacterium]|nr:ABC transporter substrate-binding protein [Nitrosomonadales bacterium]